jgi:iron complex outermembrane recepter protein
MKSMYAAWWEGFVDAAGEPDPGGSHLNRRWYVYDDRARVTTGEILLEGAWRTGPVRHTLLFGVEG